MYLSDSFGRESRLIIFQVPTFSERAELESFGNAGYEVKVAASY